MVGFFLLLLSLVLQARAEPRTPPPADKDDAGAFTIGVLRRDGIVSPFAAFDGKHWTAPWPTELSSVELPIDISGIPPKWWGKSGPVADMTAWVDGASRGAIHLDRPTVIPLMCESRLAVVSNYRSALPSPPSLRPPYPKDGLAVTGTQRVGRIEILSAESPEWSSTQMFLATEFDRSEHAAIGLFTDWKDPIPRAVRRKVPVELEALYRAGMDEAGWTSYYIEAVKRYPPGPEDEGCGLVTSANGWMAVGPDGKRSVHLDSHVTYCDRRPVTYMLPLGLLTVQGRSYWAFQLSGYGREGYVVVRPTPKRVEAHVRYPAGSCPMR
jgi:hypothetical protein